MQRPRLPGSGPAIAWLALPRTCAKRRSSCCALVLNKRWNVGSRERTFVQLLNSASSVGQGAVARSSAACNSLVASSRSAWAVDNSVSSLFLMAVRLLLMDCKSLMRPWPLPLNLGLFASADGVVQCGLALLQLGGQGRDLALSKGVLNKRTLVVWGKTLTWSKVCCSWRWVSSNEACKTLSCSDCFLMVFWASMFARSSCRQSSPTRRSRLGTSSSSERSLPKHRMIGLHSHLWSPSCEPRHRPKRRSIGRSRIACSYYDTKWLVLRLAWGKPQVLQLLFLLLQATLHFDAELLQVGQSALSTGLGIATSSLGLLECGLQLTDLSGQTGVLQIKFVEFAVGVGKASFASCKSS